MKLSALLAPLIEAKADHDLIMRQILAYEAEQADALEVRRQHERDRQAKHRLSRDSRDPSEMSRDRFLASEPAPVEDKLLTQKIEPQVQEKKGKGAARASRLPSDLALPQDWRQDALDAGLPEPRVELEWLTMRDWSQSAPAGAKLNWRSAWRNWCRRAAKELPKSQGPPGRVPSQADVFAFIRKNGNGRQQEREDSGSIRPAFPNLPAVRSG